MFRRCNNARSSVRRYGSHQMITAQLISSRRSSLFCPPQPQYMRIARNHSGLGAFLFKFHLLRLRRLSSHQIGYPFHARRLIWTSPMQQAGGCSVFPRCTFRKEMVIYTHRSMSLSACWNSFIINHLFNTETWYDTPTRKSSFSTRTPEELHYPIRFVLLVHEVKPSYHGQISCSLQVKYIWKRFEAGKVQPVFFLPKNTINQRAVRDLK